jgi:aldehyde dehydrogenase (NAD+)
MFEYAPAPESRDIARLKPSYQIFVDGKFRDGRGEAIKTINPADESPLAEVAEAGTADVVDAVKAARKAAD